MRVAIIGSGPTGLFLGAALARRGHGVTAVDRDPGPGADGSWPRRGVMQFHHAHAFRGQVPAALRAELPEAYDEWVAGGAEQIRIPRPDGTEVLAGMRSRRETFERALRAAAARQPGLELRLRARRRGARRRRAGARSPRRRAGPAGRPGDRRLRPLRSRHPGPAAAPERRRRHRRRLRRPAVPAPRRRRTGTDGEPDRLAGRARRLPGDPLPARARHLLGAHRAARRRAGPGAPAAHRRVRGRLPCGARARDLDRSGPVPAHHRRADGWRAGQPLPRPDGCRRRPRAARPGVRRRRGLHDHADVRPGRDHVVPAGT